MNDIDYKRSHSEFDIDYRPFKRSYSEFDDVCSKIVELLKSSVDKNCVSINGTYNELLMPDSIFSEEQFCIEVSLNKFSMRKIFTEQELSSFDARTSRNQMAQVISQSLLDEFYQLIVKKVEEALGASS